MRSRNSDRGKGLAFAAAVVVLAAVGVYLTMSPGSSSGGDEQTREQSVVATPRATAAVREPSPVATTPGAFDVYAYLPLSREEIGAAADLARRFTEAYGTFSPGEEPAARADRLKRFATDEFAGQLTRTVTDPAVVQQNEADQVTSKGSAKVTTIRDMTADQVVFVVGSVRHVTDKNGQKDVPEQFAVTVVKAGTDWRVYDLQLADAGQDGDTSP
ncbi:MULTISPECIES: hypothetical protein [Microbispora]|uniref:Mce-associated membrane protein n=1 Tax=Microbispora siamensis TaxID=564413 RepID=A0ABQ4GP88_9ACTN|nr:MULTISPECIES: hypothetical protein [Microbispora]OPG09842.1 hypothetical protein B1L11_24895 [Microbispora sp. GKU 823]GIH63238.1 hypothetical protein Msi02_40550 [Microbispora siamensis]